MVRTPSYGDLQVDGEALQRRLGEVPVSVDFVDTLVRDIRAWQLRCATTVAVRNPKIVAAFRVETGPIQRLLGDGWIPTPGWQAELDQSLDDWLRALARVRNLERAGQHGSRRPPKREVGPEGPRRGKDPCERVHSSG